MRLLRRGLLTGLLLSLPVLAVADGCQQFTVMSGPGQPMKMCTQCCYGGQCQVSCL